MPAGLSQITQSNRSRSSPITRATPSAVSASLSRVCDAGSNDSVSRRLSRISACGSLASPCTTLIRSYTTRRSAPITRSRLRSPTSKSTTTTFAPPSARAAPSAAVDVVLPTPPFPDVTTSTVVMSLPLPASVESRQHHRFACQPGMHRAAAQLRIHVIGGLIHAVDREQLGLHLAAENARAAVAAEARNRAAAQRA